MRRLLDCLRAWVVRRLTSPQLGERRRFRNMEWILVGVNYSDDLYQGRRLTLEYEPYPSLRSITWPLPEEDLIRMRSQVFVGGEKDIPGLSG